MGYLIIISYKGFDGITACGYLADGPLTTVLEFQARNAFCFVEEDSMERLAQEVGTAAPALRQRKGDYKLNLRLLLMKKLLPDNFSQADANLALAKTQAAENVLADSELPIAGENVSELLNPQDARSVAEFMKDVDTAKLKKTSLVGEQHDCVPRTFKLKGKLKTNPKPPAIVPWVAPPKGDLLIAAERHLIDKGPKDYIRFITDDVGGRFKVVSSIGDAWVKSVSWTRRGMDQCLSEALYHAWLRYGEISSMPVPPNLADQPAIFAVA